MLVKNAIETVNIFFTARSTVFTFHFDILRAYVPLFLLHVLNQFDAPMIRLMADETPAATTPRDHGRIPHVKKSPSLLLIVVVAVCLLSSSSSCDITLSMLRIRLAVAETHVGGWECRDLSFTEDVVVDQVTSSVTVVGCSMPRLTIIGKGSSAADVLLGVSVMLQDCTIGYFVKFQRMRLGDMGSIVLTNAPFSPI